MAVAHQQELDAFAADKRFRGKGPLCVALVVTRHAKRMGLPLDPNRLLTEDGGQVLGLGKGAVQSVLKRHGVTRVLADEGRRTSRGSLENMREYVAFLNETGCKGAFELDEAFCIEKVHEFFAGKPFKIKLDAARSLRMVVRDVVAQAVDRAQGKGSVQHNSFSTADAPGSRAGDFLIGDVAVHVTTSPGEAAIEKCRENGYRPMLVTLQRGLTVAEGLAGNAGLADRVDIFEVEQFVALNLYECGKFGAGGRKTAVADLVDRYNAIVDEVETDPSLRIELRR